MNAPLARVRWSVARVLDVADDQVLHRRTPDQPEGHDDARFMDLVRAHRLAPALGPMGDHLELAPAGRVQLEDAWKLSQLEGQLVAMSTMRACAALSDAGIPALAFKGAGLAWLTTGDLAGRGGGDIDVLVPPQRAADAIEALAAVGGEVLAPSFRRPGEALWESFTRLYNEFPVQFGVAEVDVHWRFDPVPEVLELPFEDLWSRSIAVPVSGASMQTLCVDDALLVAALHGAKDRWQALRRVIDFVRLARLVTDWDDVCNRADAHGARPLLNLALCFASSIAADLLVLARRFGRSSDWHRAEACWQALQRRGRQVPNVTRADTLRTLRWQWSTMPGARARWHLLERSLIYFKDMERIQLPPALLPLYIPMRPFMSLLPDPVNGPRTRKRDAHVG